MRWIINIVTSYLRFVVLMVVVFFLTPFIVGKIGIDQFGLWSLIFSVVAIFGLMDLGFATAANKYMGEFHGSSDHAGRNQVLATLLLLYVGLGLICIAVVAVVSTYAGEWFDLAPEMQHWFQLALWLLGGVVAINLPLNLFKAVLNGSGRMALVNGIDMAAQLLNAALVVTLLNADYGIRALIFSTALTMLLGPLLATLLAFWLTPGLSVSPRRFSRSRVRELLGFSFYFFISNIAVLVILRIDPVVIKAFLPLSAVAVYAIGAKIAEYAYYLNKQFSNALMPLVAQSQGGGDDATIDRVLLDGTRLGMAIALPFIALLFFYTDAVILLWMSEDFAGAIPVLKLLLGAILSTALQLNAANVLAMTGHHRFIAIAMAGSAVLNLVLSLILIQTWGLNGVALATLIAAFTVEVLVIIPRACWARGISLWRFFSRALWPVLPPLLPALGVAWGLDLWQPSSEGFLWIILEGGAAALVYFAGFYLTALRPEERAFIAAKLPRRARRRPKKAARPKRRVPRRGCGCACCCRCRCRRRCRCRCR
ncbi:MAG: MATE family efflux transporter [Erythrobacter sp.]|jgi:O-antigen/teichoic acid export membrane protein|nr:MATE family efflux transporter [Erythrobacter sp.]